MEYGEHKAKENPLTGMQDTARRIRHWRTEAGLKPVQLARALEMSEASVSRWESGGAEPSTKTLRKIAEVCGVSFQVFWGRLPEPAKESLAG